MKIKFRSQVASRLLFLSTLYTCLLNAPTTNRRSARAEVFSKLGYIFVDWKSFEKVWVRDSRVWLKWAAPLGKNRFAGKKHKDLPLCVVYTDEYYDNDDQNMKKYVEVALNAPEIILLVHHDIVSRKDAPKLNSKSNVSPKMTPWSRGVNLMDVVLSLIRKSCGL